MSFSGYVIREINAITARNAQISQRPSAPSNKRKLEINGRDAGELGLMILAGCTHFSLDAVYKATKITANGDVKSKLKATSEDVGEDDDDVAAGPELPPDADEQLPEDDDEGRFFGGGLTKDTADVMDFIDEQDNDENVRLDARSD